MSIAKALDADQRADALEQLGAGELDVLVVGGGIVGVGAALDAVTRGLRVGLVEQRDLASGTSSRSSKLVHGGLRYLEMFDFALVKEALEERGLLLTRLAPHLVRPVPFLYPLEHAWERPYVGAGVALYDGMAMTGKYDMGVPKHKHIFRKQLARMAPDIRTDDAARGDPLLRLPGRRRAAGDDDRPHRRQQRRPRRDPHQGHRLPARGRPRRRRARSATSRASATSRSAPRSSSTRPACGPTRSRRSSAGTAQLDVDASKGIHLVVPKDRIRSECGFITKTEKSVLFVIPWGQFWIIGTTDTPVGPRPGPPGGEQDRHRLPPRPRQPAAQGPARPPRRRRRLRRPAAAAQAGAQAGGEQRGETTKLSREHTVANPVPGLVLVAGGKLTTYRVMARDAVDHAHPATSTRRPRSITDRVPLMGAWGFEARSNQRVALSRSSGLDIGMVDHLLGRYGGLVDELLALIHQRPELAEPLPGAEHYLKVEVLYAVTHEGARHLDDVLARRTRVSIETFDRGIAAARPAAELMAEALGWDDAQLEDEVDHYLRRVEAERQSQLMPTDQEADEARVKAPDIV